MPPFEPNLKQHRAFAPHVDLLCPDFWPGASCVNPAAHKLFNGFPNAFFPAAGVVGNAQEREEAQAEADEAQRELEIDPNQAIYKADQVDVKTGEEQEQTLFTLDKAKLFEYQKADDDAAVIDYRTQNQPLSSSFPFN